MSQLKVRNIIFNYTLVAQEQRAYIYAWFSPSRHVFQWQAAVGSCCLSCCRFVLNLYRTFLFSQSKQAFATWISQKSTDCVASSLAWCTLTVALHSGDKICKLVLLFPISLLVRRWKQCIAGSRSAVQHDDVAHTVFEEFDYDEMCNSRNCSSTLRTKKGKSCNLMREWEKNWVK